MAEQENQEEITVEIDAGDEDIKVEVSDDTPEEDRGREPLP